MELEITGVVWFWRGPSPYHFVTVPPEESALIRDAAPAFTYGWGMVPVRVAIGATTTTTSLWPKDGGYALPLKAALRRAEGVEVGDEVVARLRLGG